MGAITPRGQLGEILPQLLVERSASEPTGTNDKGGGGGGGDELTTQWQARMILVVAIVSCE